MNVITEAQIYWLTRCDGIRNVLGWNVGFAFLCLILVALGTTLYFIQMFGDNSSHLSVFGDYSDDDMRTVKGYMRRTAKFSFILTAVVMIGCCLGELVLAFIPTNKEMAAIMVIPRIANSQSVQDIGSGIVDLAKDWMEELSPKHKAEETTKGRRNNE